MPSDERKQVGPDPAKPRKDDTGRSILLRIIRGGTPVLDPDQHPVDPSFDGSVVIEPPLIVTGWCTSVPTGGDCLAVPRRGHHVENQGFPGFSNGFTAKLATPENPAMTRMRMETSLGVGSAAATGP